MFNKQQSAGKSYIALTMSVRFLTGPENLARADWARLRAEAYCLWFDAILFQVVFYDADVSSLLRA